MQMLTNVTQCMVLPCGLLDFWVLSFELNPSEGANMKKIESHCAALSSNNVCVLFFGILQNEYWTVLFWIRLVFSDNEMKGFIKVLIHAFSECTNYFRYKILTAYLVIHINWTRCACHTTVRHKHWKKKPKKQIRWVFNSFRCVTSACAQSDFRLIAGRNT